MPRYNYPFSNSDQHAGIRTIPSFSLQAAINATHGLILEVGGPTLDGFFFLKNIDFPRRPIITNKHRSGGGAIVKERREIMQPYIETTLDIMRARMDPGSVGVCLAARLDVLAHEPPTRKEAKRNQALVELELEDRRLQASPESMPKVGLRYIVLHRALTFMEAGGVMIIEDLRKPELHYALKIGFHLKATCSMVIKDSGQHVYPAVVLKR